MFQIRGLAIWHFEAQSFRVTKLSYVHNCVFFTAKLDKVLSFLLFDMRILLCTQDLRLK